MSRWIQRKHPNLDPTIYQGGGVLSDWLGYCLAYVQSAFGTGWAGSTAAEARSKSSVRTDAIPGGVYVLVWFTHWGTYGGVYKEWGHVAIYKDGKIWSSPLSHKPYPDVFNSIADIESKFACKYVGWSGNLSGTVVAEEENEDMRTMTYEELKWNYRLIGGYEPTKPELDELWRKIQSGLEYDKLNEEMKTWYQQRGIGYYQYRERAERDKADLRAQLERSNSALAAERGAKDKLVVENTKLLTNMQQADAAKQRAEASLAESIQVQEKAKKEADNFLTAVLNAVRGLFGGK